MEGKNREQRDRLRVAGERRCYKISNRVELLVSEDRHFYERGKGQHVSPTVLRQVTHLSAEASRLIYVFGRLLRQ